MTEDEKWFEEQFKHLSDDDGEEPWDEETQRDWDEKMNS